MKKLFVNAIGGLAALVLNAQATLVQHLDATLSASVTGSPVTVWADLSGNGNDAVDNRGDVYFPSTSVFESGLAGLDFGLGRNDLQLFDAAGASALLDFSGAASGNSGFSALVAFKVDQMPGFEQHVIGTRHQLNNFAILVAPDGTLQLQFENMLSSSGAAKVAAGDTVVVAVTFDASTGEYRFWESLNGALKSGTQAVQNYGNGNPLVLGEAKTTASSDLYLRGLVGEVKLYDHTLSQSDFIAERDAMTEKWADISVPIAVNWRVIPANTNYPTDDVIMAAVSLSDSGFANPLPADPATMDCTATFQEALNVVGADGGGTVFVPEGEYRIDGPLSLGANVILRGRWRQITESQPASGTILKLYETGTDPVINLTESSSGLRDLTFWHPDQDPDNINTNYPFVIKGQAGVMTLENITLINAVNGIDSSKASYCCIRGIYGSPLLLGLTADQSFAVSRFDSIHFSPETWAWSGLPGSPSAGGAHEAYIRNNGLAVHIREMDGFYFQNSEITGYRDGLMFSEGISGDDPHGDLSYLTISNCTVALHVLAAKSFKVLGCTFSGTTYGIFSEHNTDMSINTSLIEGGTHAIRTTSGGDLNLVNCTVNGTESTSGGSLVKNNYDIVMPKFSYDYDAVRKPATTHVFNVKDYGAVGDQVTDDTTAFTNAIDAANSNGGGIVFVPAGEYVIDGHLNLSSGVELRGISGGRQQADSDTTLGSLILINNSGESETGAPFITLGDTSGVRGLSFHYLDQDIVTFVPHPWMIQGNGIKNYIIDCFASNPYQAAELNGDDHLVEYTFFGGIRATYRANNCSGGRIQNCHIKPDFWRNIEIGNYPANLTQVHETKWRQTHQIEVFHLNGCDDYSISSIFNHASHKFMTVDHSSGQTLMISGEQVQKGYTLRNGSKTFDFLNSSCNINSIGDYSGSYGIKIEPGFKGNARFYTSSIWGTADSTWDASDGKLYLQQCYASGPSNRGCINFRSRAGGNIQVQSGNSEMRFGLENEGVFTMQDFDFRKGCVFAVTPDYVANNLIDETYIVADINQDPALDYGIALDTNNIVMEDAMIMSDSDPAGLNDQRRVKGARLSSGTSFSLDVTEPEFSNGTRPDVGFEVYMLVDRDCTVSVYYHSSTGMKLGKATTYNGYSTNAAWKTIRFSKSDVQFGSTEDIRVDVTGDSPLLAMVLVDSTDLPVGVVPDGYDLWVDLYGGPNLIGAATTDYDGDGAANLLEYALGGNPTNSFETGDKALSLVHADGALQVVHPQRADDANLLYILETTTNLVSGIWTNAQTMVTGTNDTEAVLDYVTNSVPTDLDNQYIRLKVSR